MLHTPGMVRNKPINVILGILEMLEFHYFHAEGYYSILDTCEQKATLIGRNVSSQYVLYLGWV